MQGSAIAVIVPWFSITVGATPRMNHNACIVMWRMVVAKFDYSIHTIIFGSLSPPPEVLMVGEIPTGSYTLPIVLFLNVGVSG